MDHEPIPTDTADTNRRLRIKIAARSVVRFSIVVLVLFLTAGRVDYWQGWIFTVIFGILLISSLIQFSDRIDLAMERLRPGPGIKWWDRIFIAFYLPLSIGIFVVGGLDAGRFGWTRDLPIWVYPVSIVVCVGSFCFTRWAMLTNRWFSSVVRIQTDRGQRVVREGPYRFVRHPGYLGIILSFMAVPLILGSLWALIPAGSVSLLLIVRTCLEDRILQEELAGYADYAQEVRYRLLPRVW